MKRFAIALLLLLIVGCGSEPTPTPTQTPTPLPTATPSPTPPPTATPTPTVPPTATSTAPLAPTTSEPADVVKKLVGAIQRLDVEQAVTYFCGTQEPEMRAALQFAFEELAVLGLNPDELLQAFTLDLQALSYEEQARDGDEATVHVSGQARLDFETEVLKEVLRKVAEAAGEQITDQELSYVVSLINIVAQQGIALDADIKLVRQDGQWLVCDDLAFVQDMFQLPLP